MVPIYWLVNMSFKTTNEILGGFTLWPHNFTFANYRRSSPIRPGTWATEFDHLRQHQHGDLGRRWRCRPPMPSPATASSATSICSSGCSPTAWRRRRCSRCRSSSSIRRSACSTRTSPWRSSHCLFNIPLAVWILEGFMSGVPKEIDETAYIDGYSFPQFFVKIFMPLIAVGHRRHRVLLLHVLVGRAAARQDADLGRGQADRGGR